MKDLLQDIKAYELFWYIDNGVFKIEHRKYFEDGLSYGGSQTVGIDATLLVNPENGKQYINATDKWEYLKADNPQFEKMLYEQADQEDFVGVPIEYSTGCVEGTSELSIKEFVCDLDLILGKNDEVSNQGFCLVCALDGEILNETGELSGDFLANGRMSAANYMARYWLWGRVLIQGELNNSSVVFESTRKEITQDEVKFPLCCEDLNPFELITTNLGDGEVDTAQQNIKTEMLIVKLIYDD